MAESKPSLVEQAKNLRRPKEGAKETPEKAGERLHQQIKQYLGKLKEKLSKEEISGEELRVWIYSTARILGVDLAKEVLSDEAGTNLIEGINNVITGEEDILESKKILRANADASGMSLTEYLNDERVQPVTEAVGRKMREIKNLRPALREFALSLVDTLYTNNSIKGGFTNEELCVWEQQFSPVEAPKAETYESQAAAIIDAFVKEQSVVEDPRKKDQWADQEGPSKIEFKKAAKTVAWTNYANEVKGIIDTHFGKSEETKKQYFLKKFLNTDARQRPIQIGETESLVIFEKESIDEFSVEGLKIIAREYICADTLARIDLNRGQNVFVIEEAIKHLAVNHYSNMTWNKPDERYHIGTFSGTFKGKTPEETKEILDLVAEQNIDLLNAFDAMTKHLFETSGMRFDIQAQGADHKMFSPMWTTRDSEHYPKSSSYFPRYPTTAVTIDGVLYTNPNAKIENKESAEVARAGKEAFEKQISAALNAGKSPDKRVPITTADYLDRADARIKTAEEIASDSKRRRDEADAARKAAEAGKTQSAERIATLEAALAAAQSELKIKQAEATAAKERLATTTEADRAEIAALKRMMKLSEARETINREEREKDQAKLGRWRAREVEVTKAITAIKTAADTAGKVFGISKTVIYNNLDLIPKKDPDEEPEAEAEPERND